ncbi:hypothetical protein QOZ88_06035 [Blastococcus sp. BMG 814]|uniref:DNA segregation ATPase FtsK/SpoIIIE, S-DNA-T family n=1 Tax=Blastococcus carthaginiensis TaxID=3050034 RepID=A0ABT9I9D0_9ACTN|nr:hypothetical protein [Blastococcus carthaginiensis]MDP5182190.1 hypothetical protein [Blastococcus carthaginiensis]
MSTTALPRPEPVTRAGLIAGTVAGLIITIGGLARALGWLTDDLDVHEVARQVSDLILGAGVLWATLAPAVLALWARSKVTPLADPRDVDGNPLVVDSWPVDVVTTNPADLVTADPRDHYLTDDEPGEHAAPEPTTQMPALPVVPAPVEPTPIALEVAAALTDTQPAIPAVRV